MPELLGITNMKKLVKFSCDLTQQINESLEDGWQWVQDPISFLDEAMQVPGVAKSFPEIKKELDDLSDAEREELKDYLQEEFDIPDDELEVVIENSIMQAVSLVQLVNAWKRIKNGA